MVLHYAKWVSRQCSQYLTEFLVRWLFHVLFRSLLSFFNFLIFIHFHIIAYIKCCIDKKHFWIFIIPLRFVQITYLKKKVNSGRIFISKDRGRFDLEIVKSHLRLGLVKYSKELPNSLFIIVWNKHVKGWPILLLKYFTTGHPRRKQFLPEHVIVLKFFFGCRNMYLILWQNVHGI